MVIAADLEPLAVPTGSLGLLPGNPRIGDVSAVARSLARFGQRKPVVARKADRVVIAGNHTLRAARELGWARIAVVWVEDDEAMSQAFALADNRTADLGSYDEDALGAMVCAVQEYDPGLLADTGWAGDDLDELLASMQPPPDALTDPDDFPDVPSDPVSTLGDMWILGGGGRGRTPRAVRRRHEPGPSRPGARRR